MLYAMRLGLRAWPKVLVVILLSLTAFRVVGQGIFRGASSVAGESSWIGEELGPLLDLIGHGEPITHIDPRQYGATVFLIMDPALRLAGEQSLTTYILFVSLFSAAASFALVARLLFRRDPWGACWLAVGWFNFAPLVVGISARTVDTWQLFFVSVAMVLLVSRRATWATGISLAAAALAKIVPVFMLAFIGLRDRRAVVVGLTAAAMILGAGHLLYGPLMGFGYPVVIAAGGVDTTLRFGTHWENDSLRGLINKAASGFRVQTDPGTDVISGQLVRSPHFELADMLAFALALLILVHLVVVTWRARSDRGRERLLLEFGMALVVMSLISPHTSHEHMATALPALAVAFWLWRRQMPRSWPLRRSILAGAGTLLVGVFAPFSIVGQVLQLDKLLVATGNGRLVPMPAIGAYDLFAFPAIGLVLIWLAFVDLEHAWGPPAGDLPGAQ